MQRRSPRSMVWNCAPILLSCTSYRQVTNRFGLSLRVFFYPQGHAVSLRPGFRRTDEQIMTNSKLYWSWQGHSSHGQSPQLGTRAWWLFPPTCLSPYPNTAVGFTLLHRTRVTDPSCRRKRACVCRMGLHPTHSPLPPPTGHWQHPTPLIVVSSNGIIPETLLFSVGLIYLLVEELR